MSSLNLKRIKNTQSECTELIGLKGIVDNIYNFIMDVLKDFNQRSDLKTVVMWSCMGVLVTACGQKHSGLFVTHSIL